MRSGAGQGHLKAWCKTGAGLLQAHLQVLNEQRANLFEIIGCEDRPDELTMLRAALAEINQQIAFVSSRLVCCLRGCHVHLGAPSGSC